MSPDPLFLASDLLGGFGDFAGGLLGLGHGLDDTDSNGLKTKLVKPKSLVTEQNAYLSHVTHGETSERLVIGKSLNTHWLGGNHLDNGSITRLDELGIAFGGFTSTTINLLQELGELASNVGGVTVEHWSVTGTDLARMIENDDLGVEGVGTLGGVILGVTGYVTTTDLLDRDVLNVEADVVSWLTRGKLYVVHFHRLDFSGHVGGSESHNLDKKELACKPSCKQRLRARLPCQA